MKTSKRAPNEFRETTNEAGIHPPEKSFQRMKTGLRERRMRTGLLCVEAAPRKHLHPSPQLT
ncbi:MAG: hypothetical protein QF886_11685, partial [Planctomycetota bacterium]|nr:hypothetical protein [Planctomycetota bacterium]